MEIQGNVMAVGQVQTGQGKNGEWKRQDVVVEFFEFPTDMWTQKVIVSLTGSRTDMQLAVGDKVKVRFALNVREWEGRYYQEIRLAQDGIVKLSSLPDQKAAATAPAQPTEEVPAAGGERKADNLPF